AGWWRVGRLLQPECAAVHSLEAAGVEEDGAVFAAPAAVVAAYPLAAMARQLRLQEPPLPVQGLLHTKAVRPGGLEGLAQGGPTHRPAMPAPWQATVSTQEDVPTQDADGSRVGFRGRHWTTRADGGPGDERHPGGEPGDQESPRAATDTAE